MQPGRLTVVTVHIPLPPLGTFLGLLLRQLLLQRPLPVLVQADGTVLLHGVQRYGVLGVLLLQSRGEHLLCSQAHLLVHLAHGHFGEESGHLCGIRGGDVSFVAPVLWR